MSMSTSTDPVAGLRNLSLDKEEEDDTPQRGKTMEDLPAEVLTTILELLILNQARNNMLCYRLVSSQWKDILESLFEKKVISGELPLFPELKVDGQPYQLFVYRCSPVFEKAEAPFPASSLILYGRSSFPTCPSDADTTVALPPFLSKFGATLTVLKVLQFNDVKLWSSGPQMVLLSPPQLPSLVSLKIYSKLKKRDPLSIWMATSYADQLVCLDLQTNDPFPALQQRHRYSYQLDSGQTVRMAFTSNSAFANLKGLIIAQPTGDFFCHSEIPSLRQLSVNGFGRHDRVDLWDLLHFIVKCKSTLEQLSLNVELEQLVYNQLEVQQVTEGVLVPKLKTLAIHYPSLDFQERILSEGLLLMFPALEELQLLNFMPHDLDCSSKKYPVRELDEDGNDVERGDGAVYLKEQCSLLRQRIRDIQRNADEFWARDQAPIVLMEQKRMANEAEEFQRALLTARAERDSIFQRLEAVGVKRETVIVEQLLERQEIWRACANLKIVTVSSGRKPDGDICRMRKPNDA